MTPIEAYWYSLNHHIEPGFDLEYYQEIACNGPYWAYQFALFVPGADIKYCQEYACKDPGSAYCFAANIPGADIEYCRKTCEYDKYYLDDFDKMIAKKALL